MDIQQRLADLIAAYDANVDGREERGEPDWRNLIRADFAERLPSGGSVLEIGAGVGFTAQWFDVHGFDVTATDLSPANVAKIRDKGVTAEVRDMANLGFPDASFDGVWAASCLMHIPDAELPAVLAGIAAVIRPGGWFWAGTWGGHDQEGTWEDDWYQPKRFYSLRTDERMRAFHEGSFEVVSFEYFEPEPEIDWGYQSALMRRP
ncbi:MAG: methyltransferase domain-containing protein [Acidimicrobiia bacterium]|nr:methyltransferase domain-containing protein [Acidimicrobiia bacterium]